MKIRGTSEWLKSYRRRKWHTSLFYRFKKYCGWKRPRKGEKKQLQREKIMERRNFDDSI